MNKVIAIKIIKDYILSLQFQDGENKNIDFQPLIGKGLSALLLDKEYFKSVTIDEGGGIEWPNGIDFCPNFLKEYLPQNETSNINQIA
jgi:hypothetical protein